MPCLLQSPKHGSGLMNSFRAELLHMKKLPNGRESRAARSAARTARVRIADGPCSDRGQFCTCGPYCDRPSKSVALFMGRATAERARTPRAIRIDKKGRSAPTAFGKSNWSSFSPNRSPTNHADIENHGAETRPRSAPDTVQNFGNGAPETTHHRVNRRCRTFSHSTTM